MLASAPFRHRLSLYVLLFERFLSFFFFFWVPTFNVSVVVNYYQRIY